MEEIATKNFTSCKHRFGIAFLHCKQHDARQLMISKCYLCDEASSINKFVG